MNTIFILISTKTKVIFINILIKGLDFKLYYLNKFTIITFYLKGKTNNKLVIIYII